MSEALVGIGGIVLGALIAGGWAMYLRLRDERAEARATARSILAELKIYDKDVREFGLEHVVRGRMDFGAQRLKRVEEQMQHLARYVSSDDWNSLWTALAVWRGQTMYLEHPNPMEWLSRNEQVVVAMVKVARILERYV